MGVGRREAGLGRALACGRAADRAERAGAHLTELGDRARGDGRIARVRALPLATASIVDRLTHPARARARPRGGTRVGHGLYAAVPFRGALFVSAARRATAAVTGARARGRIGRERVRAAVRRAMLGRAVPAAMARYAILLAL